MNVHAKAPITLIGGARVASGLLDTVLRHAPEVVAADSGADRALAHGVTPRAVFGDFDSISDDARARLDPATLHPMPDQDSTDFDKCLRRVSAPLIFGVGFCGERLDHQMAVCNTLVRHPAQRCVLLGETDLMVLCPPSIHLPLDEGCRVSLFPMGAVEGASDGLAYPIGGPEFRAGRLDRHLERRPWPGASVGHRAQDAADPAGGDAGYPRDRAFGKRRALAGGGRPVMTATARIGDWIDAVVFDLGRQMRWTFLPPLMVYFAAGFSGLTAIVGTFFVKEYLDLSAAYLAGLAFWAGLPWALKMPLGHLVDIIWRWKWLLVYFGAG